MASSVSPDVESRRWVEFWQACSTGNVVPNLQSTCDRLIARRITCKKGSEYKSSAPRGDGSTQKGLRRPRNLMGNCKHLSREVLSNTSVHWNLIPTTLGESPAVRLAEPSMQSAMARHHCFAGLSFCAYRLTTAANAEVAGEMERPVAWIMTTSREMLGSTSVFPTAPPRVPTAVRA